MQPQEYDLMSDLQLLILMDWREAEGEGLLGKRGVAHSAKNRADMPGWWGGPSLKSVILKPMQFSSFNPGNPRERDWPDDDQPAYQDCVTISPMFYIMATKISRTGPRIILTYPSPHRSGRKPCS